MTASPSSPFDPGVDSGPELFPDFFKHVGQVRAIRRLRPDPVPRKMLEQVLQAGVQAPSGQNQQPWKFLVLEDKPSKRWFADHYGAAMENRFGLSRDPAKRSGKKIGRQLRAMFYQIDHLHEAPVILLVCGERDWPFKVPEPERVGLAPPNYGAMYPCVQNILLACRALGLGAALTTMHQVFDEALSAQFSIPDDYGVVVAIPIGFPLGRLGPVTRKPATTQTFFNRWGEQQ